MITQKSTKKASSSSQTPWILFVRILICGDLKSGTASPLRWPGTHKGMGLERLEMNTMLWVPLPRIRRFRRLFKSIAITPSPRGDPGHLPLAPLAPPSTKSHPGQPRIMSIQPRGRTGQQSLSKPPHRNPDLMKPWSSLSSPRPCLSPFLPWQPPLHT
jgi:hypothetical protein